MSQERLPAVIPAPNNLDIGLMMSHHKRRMNQLKSKKIQCKINETMSYMSIRQQNPKKEYLLQTKHTQIQRQNRLLFQKISKPRARQYKSPTSSLSSTRHISLNTISRKQQIQQIEKQNVKMYNRIQNQKSFISFRETDQQYFQQKMLVNRISQAHRKRRVFDWDL